MSMTSSKSGFRMRVRDALRSGFSCDAALAAGLGSTHDSPHTEGARSIISTVLSGVRAGIASEHGQSVSSSTARPQSTTKTGPKPPVATAAKPQTGGVLKQAKGPNTTTTKTQSGTAKVPTSPASPTPAAVAKTPSTAAKPAAAPKQAPLPKAGPKKPTTPQSATGPKTPSIKPRKAPMAIKAPVHKPPGIRPPAKYTPDAAKAFRQVFRDAVRENQPLSKLIELGVISGAKHVQSTPESAGTLYQSPQTKDSFRKQFRDAMAKGVSTRDALSAALAHDAAIPGAGLHPLMPGHPPAKSTPGLHPSMPHPSSVPNPTKIRNSPLPLSTKDDTATPPKPRPTVRQPPPPSLQERQTHIQIKRDLRPAHVVARAYGPAHKGGTRDAAPQGYYGVVRNKAGTPTHTTGPHPSHEVAKAKAFEGAPKARTVETSRGEHGMDIRYHSR